MFLLPVNVFFSVCWLHILFLVLCCMYLLLSRKRVTVLAYHREDQMNNFQNKLQIFWLILLYKISATTPHPGLPVLDSFPVSPSSQIISLSLKNFQILRVKCLVSNILKILLFFYFSIAYLRNLYGDWLDDKITAIFSYCLSFNNKTWWFQLIKCNHVCIKEITVCCEIRFFIFRLMLEKGNVKKSWEKGFFSIYQQW